MIIGAAFGAITKSVVDDLVMPIIGLIVGKVDFANLFVTLSPGKLTVAAATLAEAKAAGAVTLNYGLFINVVINFFLIAFAVFLLVKFVNTVRAQLAGDEGRGGAAARGRPVAARDPRRAQAHPCLTTRSSSASRTSPRAAIPM